MGGDTVSTLHHKRTVSDTHPFPFLVAKQVPSLSASFCMCVCFSIHVQYVVVSSRSSENCEEVVTKGEVCSKIYVKYCAPH